MGWLGSKENMQQEMLGDGVVAGFLTNLMNYSFFFKVGSTPSMEIMWGLNS